MKSHRLIGIAGLVALLNGCYTPKHSNVLIFATNTKFALDVSYDSKMQQPNVTVGYTRQEGVWMPLLANRGKDGLAPATPNCCATSNSAARADDMYVGNEGTNLDTYSVLATFGAKFSGGGSLTNGSQASGGLAQFFATGLAARELAKRGGADLVSVRAPLTEGQATSQYIISETHGKDVAALQGLLAKKLTSDQTVNGKTFANGSDASDYAAALAEDKGDTLPNIINQPKHAAELQDIIDKLKEATK